MSTHHSKLPIGLQTLSFAQYGFSILYQGTPTRLHPVIIRSNPAMAILGKFKFLTYQNLLIQFATYGLILASHRIPRLRRPADYIFTVLAVPLGCSVVFSFWGIWLSVGRQYIFPVELDSIYPNWLNHVTHTMPVIVNTLEQILVYHQSPSTKGAMVGLTGYLVSYASILLYVRHETGFFVYPFLNHLDAVKREAVEYFKHHFRCEQYCSSVSLQQSAKWYRRKKKTDLRESMKKPRKKKIHSMSQSEDENSNCNNESIDFIVVGGISDNERVTIAGVLVDNAAAATADGTIGISDTKRPVFVSEAQNHSVPLRRTVTFDCTIDNINTYKVAWIKVDSNDTILLSVDTKVIIDDPRFKSQSSHLDVLIPPTIIQDQTSPSQITVDENSAVRLRCRADGHPKPEIIWKRENNQAFQSGNDTFQVSTSPSSSVFGILQTGEELSLRPVKRHHAGTFLIVVERRTVNGAVGATVSLECIIDGHPLPSVTWIRSIDQSALIDSQKYQIGQRTRHVPGVNGPVVISQLNISHVDRHDYGSYQCVAVNSLSNKDASIRLNEAPQANVGRATLKQDRFRTGQTLPTTVSVQSHATEDNDSNTNNDKSIAATTHEHQARQPMNSKQRNSRLPTHTNAARGQILLVSEAPYKLGDSESDATQLHPHMLIMWLYLCCSIYCYYHCEYIRI
ncbi:Lachesin [Fragariocoptes setiger]|uniref:Lachesin n=1 Tax=Fragariocoptes setiger TaxID=1670756 RepID=A0ABQ7S7C7_9ACAR|nr:Lachesin [Fragariocoptes setiger]